MVTLLKILSQVCCYCLADHYFWASKCSEVPGGVVCGSPEVHPLIWGGNENFPLMRLWLVQPQECQREQDVNIEFFSMNIFKNSHFAALPKKKPEMKPTLAIPGVVWVAAGFSHHVPWSRGSSTCENVPFSQQLERKTLQVLAGWKRELQQAAASCKRAALKQKLPGSAKAEGPAPEWNAYKNKMVTMQQRRSRDQEVSVLHTTWYSAWKNIVTILGMQAWIHSWKA